MKSGQKFQLTFLPLSKEKAIKDCFEVNVLTRKGMISN